MTEKNLIINNRVLKYIREYSALMNCFPPSTEAAGKRLYPAREKSEELVTPLIMAHQLELRPYKISTNYITLMIKIRITLDNVTDAVRKGTEVKEKFQRGDVHITFDAWS